MINSKPFLKESFLISKPSTKCAASSFNKFIPSILPLLSTIKEKLGFISTSIYAYSFLLRIAKKCAKIKTSKKDAEIAATLKNLFCFFFS